MLRIGATFGTAIAVLLVLPSSALRAEVSVYHSPNDTGARAKATPSVPAGQNLDLFLYIAGGDETSEQGEVCLEGKGGELCGWNLLVEPEGGASLVSFAPDEEADIVHQLTPTTLRANGLDIVAPEPGPVRIGVLRVNAVGQEGSVRIRGVEAVGAALQVLPIPESVVVRVPEPSAWPCGLAALLVLSRLRRRQPEGSSVRG